MDEILDPLARRIPRIYRGIRILLVDRDTTSMMYMASMLESQSYKVTTMELAPVAISIFEDRKNEFDAVMADLYMQNMTNLEFIEGIYLIKKNIPIILMSSRDGPAIWKQTLVDGACHFFEKPVAEDQLREVWQHVFRKRKETREKYEENNTRVDETGSETMVEADGSGSNDEAHEDVKEPRPRAKKAQGIVIREGAIRSRSAGRKDFNGSDPRGKSKIVEEEVGPGHRGDEQLGVVADQKQGSDRKRANGEEGGKRKYRRRVNSENPHSQGKTPRGKAGSEKKQTSSSSVKRQSLRWSADLHFKFTAAIGKLGEEKANPKTILELMNVPNLTQRQVASHLQKYKAQVQIIMDSCVDTPSSTSATGVPELQQQLSGGVGTEADPTLQLLPPVSLQNLKTVNNKPGDGEPSNAGCRRLHVNSIQIRERRETPPRPVRRNVSGKGKQVVDIQGSSPLEYSRQNPIRFPTPSTISTELQQYLVHGASSSHNPSGSNIPAGISTDQDIADGQTTGFDGFDDGDLGWLTEWLSKSMKEDNPSHQNFDGPDK